MMDDSHGLCVALDFDGQRFNIVYAMLGDYGSVKVNLRMWLVIVALIAKFVALAVGNIPCRDEVYVCLPRDLLD